MVLKIAAMILKRPLNITDESTQKDSNLMENVLKTKLLCYYVSEFKIYGMKMPINVSLQRYSSLVIITFPIVIDNTNCLLCLMSCKPVRGCSVVNFFS